ncbi:HlyD family secretion protein [Carboxylicivirga linearis]|uniref:HlyD family secretion protein n=1 Tax=Carboxylicivirga linearis TaxID=1628157 RepID=A0ABS5JPI2_9BACT|nr:HlyD family secretion protein [Carboxylicivirga linearis]MBS2096758.1 HlyD family secretion protein [Carboxylicivirga linearis]
MSENINKYHRLDNIAVRITYFIALSILLGLLIWGIFRLVDFMRYESTNDAQVKEYINPILSRATGYVQEIRFKDHQKVQKGDTLLVLDKEESMVRFAEAKAALASAQAHLKVLENNYTSATGNMSVNKSRISAEKAELWKQQQEYDRYEKLYKVEAVTLQQFENIKTKLDVAQSNYEAVKKSFEVSNSKKEEVKTQIEVAKATIEQKEAVLQKIQLDLMYAVITAPSDGYLGKKTIQKGQYIQKGQTIGFIVDMEQGKWIEANFEETQIAEMKEGQEAEISIDAYPGEVFHGKIESLSPATGSQFSLLPPDNATGNFVKITQRFTVRIQFTDEEKAIERLKAGMNAEVSVPKL